MPALRRLLGVVMDPIETINPKKDSTLAMLLAAQARGWQIVYFRQRDLLVKDGRAIGEGRRLRVEADLKTVVRPRRALAVEPRRSRRRADAKGSALRHGVHLYHLHS